MQKRMIVFLVVLTLVVSASIAVAVGPGRGMGARATGTPGSCPMMGGRMVAELGLTDAQLAQMKELHTEFFNVTKTTRDQIMAKVKEMAQLWSADEPDAVQIRAKAAEIDSLRAKIRDTGIDYLIKGLSILTAEQREKLRTIIKNRPDWCPCPGCPMGMQGMGCGMGFGMGAGMGCGMGQGTGMGYGMGNATGPRSKMGTCPLQK